VTAKEHYNAANEFNRVGDEHHITLGAGVCKGSHKGRQHNIREYKEQFE